jgi:hypothetical protein
MSENESQPISPRDRLKALQAIPERQRTDAEWDELNELEIKLASGNREGAQQQNVRGNAPGPGGHPRPGGGGGGGGGRPDHGKGQQRRKFHQRPPKPR